jgi:hypothetical protein
MHPRPCATLLGLVSDGKEVRPWPRSTRLYNISSSSERADAKRSTIAALGNQKGRGFRGRSPSKRDQNARASKRPIADAQRVKILGSRTPKTKTYPATTPSFFHFGFVSTTFFSVTGSGNSITIGLIDISTFQNTATRLPYNLTSRSHTNIRDFKLRTGQVVYYKTYLANP